MSDQKTESKPTFDMIFKHIMYKTTLVLHCVISCAIIIGIVITLLSVPQQLNTLFDIDSESLIAFLEYVINVIIAVELIHVLLHQSLDTIVQILSMAITRDLILKQMETYEMLIGVLAIAVLFVIRKYLYLSSRDKDPSLSPLHLGKKWPFQRHESAPDRSYSEVTSSASAAKAAETAAAPKASEAAAASKASD